MSWVQLDDSRAHITLWVKTDTGRNKLDYAASVYEISTSAITRSRHLLVRRGYRPIEEVPLSIYGRARKTRGVIKLLGDGVKIIHEPEEKTPGGTGESFTQTFQGDVMTASYSGAFTDTWRRIRPY
jgi:hypothetical protein